MFLKALISPNRSRKKCKKQLAFQSTLDGKNSDPSVGSPKSPKQKHRGFGGWWFSFISFHSNDGHQNLKEFANCLFGGSNSGETPSESTL